MLSVAAFTGGINASPARFRVRQYIEPLKKLGVEIHEYSAPLSSWPPRRRWLRPAWAGATLISRVPGVVRSHLYDVTLLQQTMVSTYVTLEPLTAGPRVLDIDDAIWAHGNRKQFVQRLALLCDSIICGNTFLADHVSRWNRNVTVIPTGVDTDYFIPADREPSPQCVIGWSGGSGGFPYLYQIESSLEKVLREHPAARFLVVADKRPKFSLLPPEQVIFTPWSPANEVETIQAMDIGIMPIDNSVASRGKCSYKMLLYMACGKPVVVSPFGMNTEILQMGEVGFGARHADDWVEKLHTLLEETELRNRMGLTGREIVCRHYSRTVVCPQIASHLRQYHC